MKQEEDNLKLLELLSCYVASEEAAARVHDPVVAAVVEDGAWAWWLGFRGDEASQLRVGGAG